MFLGFRGLKAPSFLAEVLSETDGHVPLLPREHRYHFFMSKHEKHKKLGLRIAKMLTDAHFKVWVSQSESEKDKGEVMDKYAMQKGVRESECILLLLTDGIFHRDRFWVTRTEVSYAVLETDKTLICVCPSKKQGGFDLDLKCHCLHNDVHLRGCCQGVDELFQPLARAIPVGLDVVCIGGRKHGSTSSSSSSFGGDEEKQSLLRVVESGGGGEDEVLDEQKIVREIVKRYLGRESAKRRLKKEYQVQQKLGLCPGYVGGGGEEETKDMVGMKEIDPKEDAKEDVKEDAKEDAKEDVEEGVKEGAKEGAKKEGAKEEGAKEEGAKKEGSKEEEVKVMGHMSITQNL